VKKIIKLNSRKTIRTGKKTGKIETKNLTFPMEKSEDDKKKTLDFIHFLS
jgi:hypothetical protein